MDPPSGHRKIAIFGSNGMLGSYVTNYMKQTRDLHVIALTRRDIDITQVTFADIIRILKHHDISKTDIVVNCAGIIPQSSQEIDEKAYINANGIFPIILGRVCQLMGCKFVHITTDCAFSGEKGSYDENDIPDVNRDYMYGFSKAVGEQCAGTVIRTSIIGEEVGRKGSLLEWVKANSGKKVLGYTNHIWNGVTCLQLAKIIGCMIDQNIFWNGVRHIYSETPVTKAELVEMISDVFGLDVGVKPSTHTKPIDRSLSSIYETCDGFIIPSIHEQLLELSHYKIA